MKRIFIVTVCCLLLFSGMEAYGNGIAAVVNGKVITMFDLDQALKPELLRQKLRPEDAAVKALRQSVLQEMVLDVLLEQEAKRLNIAVSDADVEADIARRMKQTGLSRDAFSKKLAEEGLTPAFLRSRVKGLILRQKIMGAQVARKVVVSPEEIEEYYNGHRDEFQTGSLVRVALLVFPPDVDAEKLAPRIKSGEIPFDVAVGKVSVGPNRDKGGDLGLVPEAKLAPALRSSLKGLSSGDVSSLFLLEGHKAQLALLERESGGRQLSLEEAEPQIDGILREPKARSRFEEYVRQLQSKAVIDIRL